MEYLVPPAATVFQVSTIAAAVPWALMIFLPRWRWTDRLVHSALVPGALAIAFVWLSSHGVVLDIIMDPTRFEDGLGSLQSALATPEGALSVWLHYLIFDLFVGAWIARDAQRRGINHLFVVPALLFTMLAGPFGFLLYLCIRPATGRGGLKLSEGSAGVI